VSVVLSEHLPLLATAPGGIQKLRGLILELAVRGKLVPQDANDEPASELLTRIAKERTRLEAEGICKKSKPIPPVEADEQPFALPISWKWVRLPEVYFSISPSSNKLLSSAIQEAGAVPVVDQGKRYIAGYTDEVSMLIKIPGPVVIFGDHTTERKYVDFDFVAGADGVKILRPILQYERFFFRQLQGFKLEERGYARHFKVLNDQLYALPPRAEQHRIVAKVDELMALCDRLEAEQTDAGVAHARLVDTLLCTLTQSTDAADLAANWQRLAEHFDTLFTTESSLDALKQSILQLGVSGRLTEIDAFEPLKLGDLLVDACYGTSQKCASERVIGAFPVLRIPNVVQETLNLTDLKFAVLEEKELHKVLLLDGDLVVVRTNGSAELVGRCAVVKGLPEIAAFASYMIRLRFDPSRVDPEFAQRTLRNHRLQNRMIDFARTTAGQYNVSIGRLRELEMQIPSLAEQHRIVAKVDDLMTVVDRLKSGLAESRAQQGRLATTLIESALKAA